LDHIIKEKNYAFLLELEKSIDALLKTEDKIIVAVTRKSGCGKSTFGKFVRKN